MNKHMFKAGMDVIVKENLDETSRACGWVDEMEGMIGKKHTINSVTEGAIQLSHHEVGPIWFSSKDVVRFLTEEEKIKMESAKKPVMFDPKNL